MRTPMFVVLVMVAAVTGCGNSANGLAEPRTARDGSAGGWRPTWSDVASARLRPGSHIVEPSGCTANFLFVDPLLQAYYLGTAAHCTSAGTNLDGSGVRVSVAEVGEIGVVVYDSDGDPSVNGSDGSGVNADFSLILLDPGINLIANPQMLGFAGPTGIIDCDEIQTGDLVALYGYGNIYAAFGLYARQGAYLRCVAQIYEVALPAFFGDSGGPVLHAAGGRAFGLASGAAGTVTVGPTFPLIFDALTKAGFGSVAMATIDGGYVSPERA